MKNARPQNTEASALDKRHFNPTDDLFPELLPPVVAALLPTRGTRADEALQAAIVGPINQADYWIGWRLAAYIKELEYDGWAFIKRDIIKPGCRRPITEYTIDRTDPSTAAALASRQNGYIDPSLAGWLAFAGLCAALLLGLV
ncbi:MAG: hypothetical protein IPL05_04500 [Betaproteobacteria bacterium]|nr:hypothetical protein [Betaproteobacteria bacterium]